MIWNDPSLDILWDAKSEQPIRISRNRKFWPRVRYAFPEYLKSGFITALLAPAIAVRHWRLAQGKIPRGWKTRSEDVREFMGLAVALHSCPPDLLAAEIRELKVKHLLLRIPVWEVDQLPKYEKFLRAVPDCEVVVTIMQDRRNVVDPSLWRTNLFRIVEMCWPRIKTFQIGQGMNRSKWGCFTIGEFLVMASEAESLRPKFPGIQFVGPGVLDFEPLAMIRGVAHGFPIRWDIAGSALYVDRRGSPRKPQLKIFDFKQKIYNTIACIVGRKKVKPRLWITEVNWPIKNTNGYAPTSEKECVSEEDTAIYLREYYEDAWETRLVERVYWWQLVAKGFGLIDIDDEGNLRRRPSYKVFRKLLEEGIDSSSPCRKTESYDEQNIAPIP